MKNKISEVKPLFRTTAGQQAYYEAYDKTLSIWPIPFEEYDVSTSFGSTHVIACGSKGLAPIVLLHSAQASSTMWYANIEGLSEHHRVYAIDLIVETGKSILTKPFLTRKDLANWLIEVFDSLQMAKPDIIGISRGAWNAIIFALIYPERVHKLILLSPAQAFIPIKNIGFLLATIFCTLLPSNSSITRMTRIAFYRPDRIAPEFLNQYKCAQKQFNFLNAIYVPPSLLADSELLELKVPTLLLIGDHDVVNNENSINRAKRLIARLDAEIIKDAGHILTIDQPQYVNDLILRYLSN